MCEWYVQSVVYGEITLFCKALVQELGIIWVYHEARDTPISFALEAFCVDNVFLHIACALLSASTTAAAPFL